MTFKQQNILPHEKRKTTKPNKKTNHLTKRNEIKKKHNTKIKPYIKMNKKCRAHNQLDA